MLKENFLLPYKKRIEREIKKLVSSFKEKNKLTDACRYALNSKGKRFRPILVLFLAEAIGKKCDVLPAALAVELFHTASLIADDLPCMDNEKMRRKKPALHRIYGESTALLASYTLIALAYEKIRENAQKRKEDNLCMQAIKEVSRLSGIEGATGGQFLDLFPPDVSLATIKKIIHRKTVTLFEIAFILGWLFGGGKLDDLEKVKKMSHHLGRAFQVADDFQDVAQDKKKKIKINIVSFLGKEKAQKYFEKEMTFFEKFLKQFNLFSSSFKKIKPYLFSYLKEKNS